MLGADDEIKSGMMLWCATAAAKSSAGKLRFGGVRMIRAPGLAKLPGTRSRDGGGEKGCSVGLPDRVGGGRLRW